MSRRQGINIPGVILDQLKERDYSNDVRFRNGTNNSRKRDASKQLSRKERRKQQRAEKKQRRSKASGTASRIKKDVDQRGGFSSNNKRLKGDDDSRVVKRDNDEEHGREEVKLPFSSDDELTEGDFDEFNEDDLNEEEWEQLRELEDDEKGEEEEEEDDDGKTMTVEETMVKLKELKRIKESKKKDDKDIKSASKSKDKKIAKRKDDTKVVYPLTPAERAAIERDEMDMKYYAKKLNLKGKKKKIHARDEFDAIGGLLDGLDFFENYGQEVYKIG